MSRSSRKSAPAAAAGDVSRLIHSTLKYRFGLASLRDGQYAVIRRVLAGENTLAVMPTGAGKSLCYQLPALLLPGRTVVVSPLIALMKDQCESMRELGIDTVELNSSLGTQAEREAEAAVASGQAKIVLTTPERLADESFMQLLLQHPTSLLVVDEAHCLSQWGHDFRPAFLDIAPAIRKLGRPAVLALTATATDAVSQEITHQLGIPADGVINNGVYRPNLHYAVEQLAREADKLERTVALVQSATGSGLVYVATVKAAEAVYAALVQSGCSVMKYHGKLGASERDAAQEAFMAGTARVMVATNAFGLGIDKPDIRFVVHYQMPAGLDAYYQESGRAGRDGEKADCTLLFLRGDKSVQQFFMAGRYPALDDVEALYRALQQEPPGTQGWTMQDLQQRIDRPANKLKVACSLLRSQQVVSQRAGGVIRLGKKALDTAGLHAVIRTYQARREQDRAALEAMVSYAQTGRCRWQMLLRHLQAQADAVPCRSCDNCLRIAALEAELARRGTDSEEAVRDGAGSNTAGACSSPLTMSAASTAKRFTPGEWVKVRRYGQGKVAAADALSVTVEFEAGQQRSFQADYVQRVTPRKRATTAAAAAEGAVGSA
ncbi:MAG: recombinase RecQ [Polaromonas sp.]|jgi:ATP-dependent DNA helicase RecQ|nr:recombinase RecQ [Polaromonas sp.]